MERWQLKDWMVPQMCADKPGGATGKRKETTQPRVLAREKKASKHLAVALGGLAQWLSAGL